MDAVFVLIATKESYEWLRESVQRERLNRAYNNGEPAWMAADAMRQFWQGKLRADREDQDGHELLMKGRK